MTPAARVRDIWVQAERMERAQQIFLPLIEWADDKAAMIVIRAQERRATLLGSNAPLRVDPIALAADVRQPLSSTDQLRQVFDEWRALDKKKLRNNGPGYGPGSWQDIQDREEIARKPEREKVRAND